METTQIDMDYWELSVFGDMLSQFSNGGQWAFLSPFGKLNIILLTVFMAVGVPANLLLLFVTDRSFIDNFNKRDIET